jgi:hypothetical protein
MVAILIISPVGRVHVYCETQDSRIPTGRHVIYHDKVPKSGAVPCKYLRCLPGCALGITVGQIALQATHGRRLDNDQLNVAQYRERCNVTVTCSVSGR